MVTDRAGWGKLLRHALSGRRVSAISALDGYATQRIARGI